MGAGASTGHSDRHTRTEAVAARHALIRSIEKFTINVYATCPRFESVLMILSSKLGHTAFDTFLRAEHAEESLRLYQDAESIRKLIAESDRGKAPLNKYTVSGMFKKVYDKFIDDKGSSQVILAASVRESCVGLNGADYQSDDYISKLTTLLEKIQYECVFILARDLFFRFLQSKQYKSWRSQENSHAVAANLSSIAEERDNASKAAAQTVVSSSPKFPKRQFSSSWGKKLANFSVRAFSYVDESELAEIVGNENWLAALLASVEGLPISFSICSARKTKKGFPCMYVNSYFEKKTGFRRSEVLGKNLKFLQCADTEASAVAEMSEALRFARPWRGCLTNQTSSGDTQFKNLLAIKPIFGGDGSYIYVICLSLDVTRDVDGSSRKTKLLGELIDLIPDRLVRDDAEQPPGCLEFLG